MDKAKEEYRYFNGQPVDKAYGLYINIDDSVLQMLGELHNIVSAVEKEDVCVLYKGTVRGFTLTEFLTLLGFGEV